MFSAVSELANLSTRPHSSRHLLAQKSIESFFGFGNFSTDHWWDTMI
jgi:hypothetical protein